MTYDILPFDPSPERAQIVSDLMRRIAAHETFFSDFHGACEDDCVAQEKPLVEMCSVCKGRMQMIASVLTEATSRSWEVWGTNGTNVPEPVGFVTFTDVAPPLDAKAHYIFFDSKLSDKLPILEELMHLMFEDVQRLTIEVPRPFAALARHASRKLGFGGPFKTSLKGDTTLHVEGVKRNAVKWRGQDVDLLVLGRLRDEPHS